MELNFWKHWKRQYRSIYQVLLFLFIIMVGFTIYAHYNSNDLSAPLTEVRKTQSIDLSLKNVYDFVFEISVPSRNYIIYQGFLALDAGFEYNYSLALFIVVLFGFSVLMTSATFMSRLWFIIFQSIFVVWVITLKFPYLEIFGINNQLFSFLFIGLFLAIGYYFQAFNEHANLFFRWIIFSSLLGLMALISIVGTEVQAPVIFMMHHGIIVPLILAILFIFNVAYEVILHILYLLASKRNKEGNSNLIHFVVLSLLYLAYVGLTFSKSEGFIDWDLIYLNPFVMLAISSTLGVWGFKKRSELFQNQLSFRPLGGYIFLVTGIMSFALLSWIFINGNDPLVDAFEDMIIYSHLCFGVLFFIYVIYNFVGLLNEGHAVYPVIFRPVTIPYNLVRLVGFGLVATLVIVNSYWPYYKTISGYYNGLASYYEHIGEKEKSKTTFGIARQYASTNHKSNFKLGQLAYEEGNWARASTFFNRANYKSPSVQAYINRAQTQLNANLLFEALFTLQEGQKDFPDNGYLLNMIGLIYEQMNKADSAFVYFDAAQRAMPDTKVSQIAKVNTLGLFAKNGIDQDTENGPELNDYSIPHKTNFLALMNRKRQYLDSLSLNAAELDSNLSYNDFSYIFNYTLNKSILNQPFEEDTIGWLRNNKVNETFFKSLKYAETVRNLYAGQVNKAFQDLYELENDEISDAGFYYLLHGLWLLDQKDYGKAIEKFDEAIELRIPKSVTYKVIALIYQNRLFEAARLYEKQFSEKGIDASVKSDDPLYQFLQADTQALPDNFLYLWLRTNKSLQEEERNEIKERLEGSPFLILYQLNELEQLIIDEELVKAKKLMARIIIPRQEKSLITYKNELQLLLATIAQSKDIHIEEQSLRNYPFNYHLLWQAVQAQNKGKQALADDLMEQLGTENAYFEMGVIIASRYFNNSENPDKAYNILVGAVQNNPNSVKLKEAYALQALRINMISYAEEAYNDLGQKMTMKEWERFTQRYNALYDKLESEPW